MVGSLDHLVPIVERHLAPVSVRGGPTSRPPALAIPYVVEGRLEPRTVSAGAGSMILEHLATTGSDQGVELKREVLVLRTHPRIANVAVLSVLPSNINVSVFLSAC